MDGLGEYIKDGRDVARAHTRYPLGSREAQSGRQLWWDMGGQDLLPGVCDKCTPYMTPGFPPFPRESWPRDIVTSAYRLDKRPGENIRAYAILRGV